MKLEIALSPNSKEVIIYTKNGNNWQQLQVLTEHTSKVLSIDWAPQSNRIVSCGAVSPLPTKLEYKILINQFISKG